MITLMMWYSYGGGIDDDSDSYNVGGSDGDDNHVW